MDTIVGKNNKGAIVTLTERSTNILFMRKLPHGKNAQECAMTVVRLLEPFKGFIKTITTDNGTEFTNHEYITKHLGATVYFADPHAPWQKGSIENINGIIRQYIPNGSSFDNVSQKFIKRVQDKINSRPREKLNFLTPEECFYENIS